MGAVCCCERKASYFLSDKASSHCGSVVTDVNIGTPQAPTTLEDSEVGFFHPSVLTEAKSPAISALDAAGKVLDQQFQSAGFIWFQSKQGVLEAGELVQYNTGDVMFSKGEEIQYVYVAVVGRFCEYPPDIESEEDFGLRDSFSFDQYQGTVTAVRDSTAYKFPISAFRYPPKVLAAAALVMESEYLRKAITDHSYFAQFRLVKVGADEPVIQCEEAEMLLVNKGCLVEDFGSIQMSVEHGDWVALGVPTHTTVTARGESCVYRVSAATLKATFSYNVTEILWKNEFLRLMLQHPITKAVPLPELQIVFQATKIVQSTDSRVVAYAGKSSVAKVYTVLRGSLLDCTQQLVQEGEVFNLRTVTTSAKLRFRRDIQASENSVIAATPRCVLNQFLGAKTAHQLTVEAILQELTQVALLSNMPLSHHKNLVDILEVKSFKIGETIVNEGCSAKKLYIVLSGRVIGRANDIAEQSYSVHDYFGDWRNVCPVVYRCTCIAVENVVCWELNLLRLVGLFDDIKEELERRLQTKMFGLTADQLQVRNVLKYLKGTTALQAATLSPTGSFAVLITSRTLCPTIQTTLSLEARILRELSSPYLPYLYLDMQTEAHSLIVIKYSEGMTLMQLLQTHPEQISETLMKTYVVGVLLALKFLHEHGILHLHIRPDTIYIDESGLPILVRLRGAQYVSSIFREGIYTSEYSAPEVVSGGTLNAASDLWSLGIILIESLALATHTYLPDLSLTSLRRVMDNPEFYSKLTISVIQLINLLVFHRDVERLTTESVISHEWLSRINWVRARFRQPYSKLYIPTKEDKKEAREATLKKAVSLSSYLRDYLHDSGDITIN